MYFTTPLRGLRHRPVEVQSLVQSLDEGTALELRREPTNAFDPNAIQVFHGNAFIGYIHKKVAADIAPHMDSGWVFKASIRHKAGLDPMLTIEYIDAPEAA